MGEIKTRLKYDNIIVVVFFLLGCIYTLLGHGKEVGAVGRIIISLVGIGMLALIPFVTKRYLFNRTGVYVIKLFSKRLISWSEIQDYKISEGVHDGMYLKENYKDLTITLESGGKLFITSQLVGDFDELIRFLKDNIEGKEQPAK